MSTVIAGGVAGARCTLQLACVRTGAEWRAALGCVIIAQPMRSAAQPSAAAAALARAAHGDQSKGYTSTRWMCDVLMQLPITVTRPSHPIPLNLIQSSPGLA